MSFGFWLQVFKILSQTREHTMIKLIIYSLLQPSRKPLTPKLQPSVNKFRTDDTVGVIDQG